MFPILSFPAETDHANHAEGISHDGDAAEPTDVEPDLGENPPAS